MDSYDVIFLGYPIWWGEAPRIISTFLESYDFTDKTIVPFCTSGSSGIGSSAEHLAALAADAAWLAPALTPTPPRRKWPPGWTAWDCERRDRICLM